ncbi:hypothetical protein WS86_11535 [Burkholderia savannae]|nr:hypothetical protein WS86_11535 [Burkholderia savannae]
MEAFGYLMKRERDFFIGLVVRTARRYREIVHAGVPCNSNSKSTEVAVELETIKPCAECVDLLGQPSSRIISRWLAPVSSTANAAESIASARHAALSLPVS